MSILAILAAVAVAASSPQPSAGPAPGPQAATRAPGLRKDALVCHNEVVSGSRLPEKVCMLASEAERRRRAGRDALEKFQNANGQRGPSGP